MGGTVKLKLKPSMDAESEISQDGAHSEQSIISGNHNSNWSEVNPNQTDRSNKSA